MNIENERRLARIGLNNFLAEFSYADLEYEAPQGEHELGDHLLVLGNNALLFETKERNPEFELDTESEMKWFKKNILRESIDQHNNSQQRLSDKKTLVLTNQAGHSLPFSNSKATQSIAVQVEFLNTPCFVTERKDSFIVNCNAHGIIHEPLGNNPSIAIKNLNPVIYAPFSYIDISWPV